MNYIACRNYLDGKEDHERKYSPAANRVLIGSDSPFKFEGGLRFVPYYYKKDTLSLILNQHSSAFFSLQIFLPKLLIIISN